MAAKGGPWLQMALFCEKVLTEQDGVLTPVRVVDRVIRSVVGPEPPEQMEPFEHYLYLVLALKPGEARGRGTVKIQIEGPDGISRPGPSTSVQLEGEDRGVNLVMQTGFKFEQEGLYWLDVSFDGRLLTRIPLRVVYQASKIASGH